MKTIRLITMTLSVLGFAFGTVACHTIQGAGQDIEHAGHALDNATD